ncbi:MFS transporter [Histoplasma capsulatum]|uniref:MFS transporter n=1 Tax=Ajellomyces capsulatus TaxID=5037 RepID=A0A8A1MHM3_AJECA|nr:MFS transporter [Histoplasma capsulatum]
MCCSDITAGYHPVASQDTKLQYKQMTITSSSVSASIMRDCGLRYNSSSVPRISGCQQALVYGLDTTIAADSSSARHSDSDFPRRIALFQAGSALCGSAPSTGACAYLSGTGLFGIGRASGTWGWRWIPRFFCRLFYFYIIPIISVITGPVYLFFLPAIHPATRKSFNVRLVNLNHLGFILSARMRDFHYGIYLRRQLVAVEPYVLLALYGLQLHPHISRDQVAPRHPPRSQTHILCHIITTCTNTFHKKRYIAHGHAASTSLPHVRHHFQPHQWLNPLHDQLGCSIKVTSIDILNTTNLQNVAQIGSTFICIVLAIQVLLSTTVRNLNYVLNSQGFSQALRHRYRNAQVRHYESTPQSALGEVNMRGWNWLLAILTPAKPPGGVYSGYDVDPAISSGFNIISYNMGVFAHAVTTITQEERKGRIQTCRPCYIPKQKSVSMQSLQSRTTPTVNEPEGHRSSMSSVVAKFFDYLEDSNSITTALLRNLNLSFLVLV